MTALEKLKAWIATFPGFDILSGFQVNFIDQIPVSAYPFPAGLVELERHCDIMGNPKTLNQYNFGLYHAFEKDQTMDQAALSLEWVAEFQEWIQDQSIRGMAPVFGDEPQREKIMIPNGMFFKAENADALTYVLQIEVQFYKNYGRNNK